MRSTAWVLVCGAVCLTLAGCGQKSTEPVTATAEPPEATESATQETQTRQPRTVTVSPEIAERVRQLQSPDDVVAHFLTAMRDGDEQTITALLSNRARQATGQHEELAIQPPGSPNASYRVESVELVGDDRDGAHVTSIWSERDFDGSAIEYEVVWVLRQESDGWRIAGMATAVEEGAPPLFLNFEDPDEMLALLSAAHQQRAEAADAVYEAQNAPTVPPTTQR